MSQPEYLTIPQSSQTPTTPTTAASAATPTATTPPAVSQSSNPTKQPSIGSPAHGHDLRHLSSNGKPTLTPVKPHRSPSTQLSVPPLHGLTASTLSPTSHGNQRLGSKSPSSIPSSPTSIHSSTSAIFERDIEPLPSTTSQVHAPNPHLVPRAKATEALDSSVPSVLDSAVTALNSIKLEDPANVTVLSSAPSTSVSASGTSGGSPPPTMSLLLQNMGMPGFVSASASVSGAASVSGFASGFTSPLSGSRAPSPTRSISPTNIGTSAVDASSSSPKPLTFAASTSGGLAAAGSSPLKRPSLPVPMTPSANKATNRLSFISYNDLLTSAPIAAQTLTSVLAPGTAEPATHVVVVEDEAENRGRSGYAASEKVGEKDIDSLGVVGLAGGEWEREKLGMGLEERLERLLSAERDMNAKGASNQAKSDVKVPPTLENTPAPAPIVA